MLSSPFSFNSNRNQSSVSSSHCRLLVRLKKWKDKLLGEFDAYCPHQT